MENMNVGLVGLGTWGKNLAERLGPAGAHLAACFARSDEARTEFASAYGQARQQRAEAMVIPSSPLIFPNLRRLAALALEQRLPAISVFPQFAGAGGLMGYGPDLPDLFRLAAGYIDRILKGAAPRDLPIQRPVVFALALNLASAKALEMTLPPSFILRADQVIGA